jgi:hypothetical protein
MYLNCLRVNALRARRLVDPRERCYIQSMKRRLEDLTVEELDAFAREAWGKAAQQALASGLAVTGSRNGRRFRYHPDGRMEDLGPVDVDMPAALKAGE